MGRRGMCTAVSFAAGTSFSLWKGALQAWALLSPLAIVCPSDPLDRTAVLQAVDHALPLSFSPGWQSDACSLPPLISPDEELGAGAGPIQEHRVLLQLNTMEVHISAHAAVTQAAPKLR